MERKGRASKTQIEEHCARHRHSAQYVANAFVEQYYRILSHFPEHSYKFYRDESILSLSGPDGVRSVTTIKEIDEEIMASEIKNSSFDLLTVHGQDTVAESVIVVVVGSLSKDNVSKCFSQTFLLAPQARGFYVYNDFFQFIDASYLNIPKETKQYTLDSVKDTSTEDNIHGNNQLNANLSDTKNSELADETNKINAAHIAQAFSKSQEDVKRLSYASIVAKASLLPYLNARVEVSPETVKDTSTEAPREVHENDQNYKSSSAYEVIHIENSQIEKSSPQNVEEVEKNDSFASIDTKDSSTIPSPAAGQVMADKSSTILPTQESIATQIDKTIYIRDLPPHATRRTVTHALKRFGSIKHKNIQIRGYWDGYRYAFVEFNQLEAANLALEAGFIKLDDWECEIESKKAHFEGLEEVHGGDDDNIGSCSCGRYTC